ncbi:MAG: hypothetical protein KAS07_06095, partial [Candidatus Pacebacteria bacterium]|nr:hypothetical protein [Candidatus Paceibacterota bacterium]
MALQVIKYNIRASSLQPKGSGCPTTVLSYIYQSFGAQKTIVDVYSAKTELLKSADMQGIKPGDEEDPSYRDTTFTKASYSGKGLRTTSGDIVFSGQEEHVASFIEEDEVPGWS